MENSKHEKHASTAECVERARGGDPHAFDDLVARFQNMARACAYAQLADIERARDVAQEAFVEAHLKLAQLREPAAFPGWLRRIVHKHCDRVTRRKALKTQSIESAQTSSESRTASTDLEALEAREAEARLRIAIESLPEHERIVVALYYLAEHSQQAVAEFLELPPGTVKKRLHDARRHLRKRIEANLERDLRSLRPLTNDGLPRVVRLFIALREADGDRVAELLDADPSLVAAHEDWTAEQAVAEGMPMPTHATPLIRAAERDDPALVELLVERGAAVNGPCGCATAETPLWAAVVTGRERSALRLLELGADPDRAAQNGQTPLHVASLRGLGDTVRALLEHGADPKSRDGQGRSAADWAKLRGHEELAALLETHHTPGEASDASIGAPSAATRAARPDSKTQFSDDPGRLLETGIKAIELFVPIPLGGRVSCSGSWGLGRNILLAEWSHNHVVEREGPVVWAIWQRARWEDGDVDQLLGECDLEGRINVLRSAPDASEPERRSLAQRSVDLANELASTHQRPALLVLFEQTGYRADVITALSRTNPWVTSVAVPPLDDPAAAGDTSSQVVAPFDARIVFDPQLAATHHWPAIHTTWSRSRCLDDGRSSERHVALAARARQLLEEPERSPARAEHLRALLTQPFHVAEPFVGRPGVSVGRLEVLDLVEAALEGRYDAAPREALLFGGVPDERGTAS